jgi:acetolactate synthase-1/2/3 large subunit
MVKVEKEMTTADVIVQHLAAAGVRHLFGYPGDPNLDLIEAARVEGFELFLNRREGTAAFMAEAYGMLTGRPGVCMSTLGPGSTALVNGVANAFGDRVPMLAISGYPTRRREPYFTHQMVDHHRLYAPITKWAVTINPQAAALIMRKALRVAMAERPGPVHISTNNDVIGAPADDHEVFLPPLRSDAEWTQVFRSGSAAKAPVQMLEEARKPVVLAGISALRSGATASLKQFAEKTGCPVVVSPASKGVFPEDHPYFASVVDMACNKVVWDFLGESDLLLLVGFDAVELIKDWRLEAPAIHIDSVPNTDQIYYAETEVVGHIPSILTDLTDSFRGESKAREEDVRRHRETLLDTYYAGRLEGKLNPTDVIDAINEVFPRNTIVSTDVGSHKLLVGQGWQATEPGGFLMTNGLSAMGFSLPASMTAKLLHRDRPVVCTVGDGGFAMVESELRLASQKGLGIVVVVFCDGSLNRIELKQLLLKKYPSTMTRFEPTDLVKLAESMECHGERVDTKADLDRVLNEAKKGLGQPLVVQANIDPAQYVAQF